MKIEHVKIHGKGNRLGFVDSKTSEFVNVLLGFRRSHGRPPDSLAAERESLRLLLSNADTNSHFKKKTSEGQCLSELHLALLRCVLKSRLKNKLFSNTHSHIQPRIFTGLHLLLIYSHDCIKSRRKMAVIEVKHSTFRE